MDAIDRLSMSPERALENQVLNRRAILTWRTGMLLLQDRGVDELDFIEQEWEKIGDESGRTAMMRLEFRRSGEGNLEMIWENKLREADGEKMISDSRSEIILGQSGLKQFIEVDNLSGVAVDYMVDDPTAEVFEEGVITKINSLQMNLMMELERRMASMEGDWSELRGEMDEINAHMGESVENETSVWEIPVVDDGDREE